MKRECYIVRDLLPLYLEEIVSDETAAFVRTHLETCEECAAELEAMRSDEGLCRESVETKEHRMQEAAVLSRIERSLRKDKWISIAATAFCVIVVGVLGFIFWTDTEDRIAGNGTMAENGRVVDALGWIRVSNRSAASSKEDPDSSFCYFPAEVEGTSGTMDKFVELVEEGEEIISDNPEEILGIKIDSKEELYTFVEKMQYELKYTDAAIGEKLMFILGERVGSYSAEPQFLIYIPKGNLTHEYHVTKMERHGEGLYLSIEKTPRRTLDTERDGCLIGLSLVKDSEDAVSIKDVTRVYIQMSSLED